MGAFNQVRQIFLIRCLHNIITKILFQINFLRLQSPERNLIADNLIISILVALQPPLQRFALKQFHNIPLHNKRNNAQCRFLSVLCKNAPELLGKSVYTQNKRPHPDIPPANKVAGQVRLFRCGMTAPPILDYRVNLFY